jgi:hypothetical protein
VIAGHKVLGQILITNNMVTGDDIYWAEDKIIQLKKQLEEAEHRLRDLKEQKRREDDERHREEREKRA